MEKKLNVLFFSQVTITSLEDKSIYTDLISEFVDHGHQITVLSAFERRNFNLKTKAEKFELIKIKTPNLQKTTKVEKGLGHLFFDFQLLFAVKKHLTNRHFDICLYFSPPITIVRTLAYMKKHFGTFNYLWLKDIFPQNAIDMELMKRNSLIHKYFQKIEKQYYQLSDKIGVMSPANKEYLLLHYKDWMYANKIEVCPNCIKISKFEQIQNFHDEEKKVNLIYGGNLGIPQAIPFLIKLLDKLIDHNVIEVSIIGSGTEFSKLKRWIDHKKPQNIKLKNFLPKNAYNEEVKKADIGLILLNDQFTIPNFPSRLLTYLEYQKPILCFTDDNTDVGKIAKQEGFGDWAPSNNVDASFDLIENYATKSKEEIIQIGRKGYEYLLNHYTTNHTYNIILNSYIKFALK